MEKKLYIKTYGCQMNVHDSERIEGLLRDEGYSLTEKPEDASMIIVNTCSIRDKSEHKAFSDLGRFAQLKKEKPGLILGMAGCVAQQEGRKVLKRFQSVDMVFGSSNIENIPEMLQTITDQPQAVVKVEEPPTPPKTTPAIRKDHIRAWVSIMEGCDRHCTFCVVPTTRGRERSRLSSEILQEIQTLSDTGYKEVTLLGQTVNSYGKNSDEVIDFAELLALINGISGLERIRFMSPHPCDMTPKLIEAMAALPRVCNYLHLPMQSGSDTVLARMKRGYTLGEYRSIVNRFKERIPHGGISTDIIIGFPGETEEDFQMSLDAIREFEFDNIYYFNYSRRPNTIATDMKDQVPEDIKRSRFRRLSDLEKSLGKVKNQLMVGSIQEVLVEGWSKRNRDKMTGRSNSNKLVHFEGSSEDIGRLINLKITSASVTFLEGAR